MRVLVVGGSGVLGRAVIRSLAATGFEVTAAAQTKEKAEPLRAAGALPTGIDILNTQDLEHALRDYQWVFNLTGAIPRRRGSEPSAWQLHDRVQTEGTERLVRAAQKVRVDLFVHASCALVHGNHGANWVSETTTAVPSPALRSTLESEAIVQKAHVQGLPVIVMRPGQLYSPDSERTRRLVDDLRSHRFRVIGRGENYISPLHADDAAEAFVAAARHGQPGETYGVSDDDPMAFSEYAATWAEVVRSRPPKHTPRFLARLLTGRSAVTEATLSLRFSNAKAKEALRWIPRYPTVREGASAVVKALGRSP